MRSLCGCPDHADGAPATIAGHTVTVVESLSGWWRWTCSCGAKGRSQGQSPSVSYHQWLNHLPREAINCIHCGNEIEKRKNGMWYHVSPGFMACPASTVATPPKGQR